MNRGFTLMELLAVIIIISILGLMASSTIATSIKDSKDELYQVQITNIKKAAETWGADNLLLLPEVSECKYITVGDLKDYGLLDNKIMNPKNNTEISDDLKIKITTKLDKTETNKVSSYEVNPSNVTGCTKLFEKCTLADTNNNGTGDIGEQVDCLNEKFYIYDNTSTDYKLFAMWNLNAGNVITSSTLGIQNENAKAWTSSGSEPYPGGLAFSSSNGWVSGIDINIQNYDGPIKTAINNYKLILNDIKMKEMRLITKHEIEVLVNSGNSLGTGDLPTTYPWLYSTSYWVGTSSSTTFLWNVVSNRYFSNNDGYTTTRRGVRPVVVISKSEVK